jgi:hypothetical protein
MLFAFKLDVSVGGIYRAFKRTVCMTRGTSNNAGSAFMLIKDSGEVSSEGKMKGVFSKNADG